MSILTQDLMEKSADIMLEWGNEMVDHMQDILQQKLKRTQSVSNLAQSIKVVDTHVTSDGLSMQIEMNDYWAYVDLGVKGLRNVSGKKSGSVPTQTYTNHLFPSGFSFKTMKTPGSMIISLQSYISRKGILAQKDDNGSRIPSSFEMASSMAIAIKKKGIDGTKFYTDTFTDDNLKDLYLRLEKVLGSEIMIQVIQEIKP
jgi:hypothetical protein